MMAKHNLTGIAGESLGAAYLLKQGFFITEKNWRHGRAEVDVIASKNNTLHFIEIKTRRTKKFGLPEEQVGKKKMENLIAAAEQRDAAAGCQSTLQLDGSADVAGVLLAAGLLDVGSDRVQLTSQFLDVLGGEVGVLLDVADSHVCLLDV